MKKELLKKRKRKGFTLVELVVVIAIVAVLSGIAVAAFSQMTKASQEATFRANHRTLVSAVMMAYANNNGIKSDTIETDVNNSIVDPQDPNKKGTAALIGNPKGATYELDKNTGTVTSTWKPQGAEKAIVLTYTP